MYLKTACFRLDLNLPELESEIPPGYKLHQGPPGTWCEAADGSFSGHRSYSERNLVPNGRKRALSVLETARFRLDFHLPELENEIPPEYKLHQGPPGTWFEAADGSFSGHLGPIRSEN